ncbi:hypothetical protein K439DRAFT_1619863 [Ramaria rubella]|nr:hypothetical protein K439DRAFT_1619863 [Ramaria rubella]
MGQCTAARLAWGFVIPENKLYPLLEAFQKEEEKTDDKADDKEPDESPEPLAKKPKTRHNTPDFSLDFEGAYELIKYIIVAMRKSEAGGFFGFWAGGVKDEQLEDPLRFTFYYSGEDEEGPLTHELEIWGRENFGAVCVGLGATLNTERILKNTEGKSKQLQDDLHFKEAGIEVEEEWVLMVEVG